MHILFATPIDHYMTVPNTLYLKLALIISWYFLLGVTSHTSTVGYISIDSDGCVTVLCDISDQI